MMPDTRPSAESGRVLECLGGGVSGTLALAGPLLLQARNAVDGQCNEWLEVNCHEGEDVFAAAELLGSRARVTGIDSRVRRVAEAQAIGRLNALTTEFACTNPQKLPFSDERFDVIRWIALGKAHGFGRRAMVELNRVLAPNGRLILQVGLAIVASNVESTVLDQSQRLEQALVGLGLHLERMTFLSESDRESRARAEVSDAIRLVGVTGVGLKQGSCQGSR